jgi:hypothetical protein
MTKLLKIENDIVVNVIEGDSFEGYEDSPEQNISKGWVKQPDGTFIPPEKPAEPAPLPTDQLINRVQFKSMLAILGKSIDDVMAAIDAAITDKTQNTIAKVKVTDSDQYARDNELFTVLAPLLNLTDAEIDAAWAQALEI